MLVSKCRDAQNILDEKQKRINDARIALQLLRTTCIVWPNSGSEVLLAGSFDGWSTQVWARVMYIYTLFGSQFSKTISI